MECTPNISKMMHISRMPTEKKQACVAWMSFIVEITEGFGEHFISFKCCTVFSSVGDHVFCKLRAKTQKSREQHQRGSPPVLLMKISPD